MFGNKYISFSSPKDPSPQRITSQDVIDASSVTTEFNTVFETVTSIAEQVDPIKLNAHSTRLAEAMAGLGERFGDSLINANRIMDDLNPRMPQIRADIAGARRSRRRVRERLPRPVGRPDNAVTTARTLNDQQGNIDTALMAAIGFGNTAADSFERGGPYFVRAAEDLLPTTKLLDDYRGMIFCTIRNYAEVAPRLSKVLGGDNGYALKSYGTIALPGNPFIYPDNLPRVNAHGGPEGRPGCWQKVTKDLYPFPYLVMDTGYSIAPVQPLRVRIADGHRLHLGPTDRRDDDQPLAPSPRNGIPAPESASRCVLECRFAVGACAGPPAPQPAPASIDCDMREHRGGQAA